MNLLIQTFPMKGKTLYFVQCPSCKRNRILNSGANVSNMVSEEAFRKLCGCVCKMQSTVQPKTAKRRGKTLTAVINGVEMTVKEISDTYGIGQTTVRQRINAGKSEQEIIAPTKRK
ncbi:DUF3797 domain-containing protein [Ectobacillus sp. JY-23]|uniref:DUF3797 domain-containing protein n=1 Tax=Ectobacillus sp. JY-23 TaxID=2933872 RepID=UPI001FF4E768|nr:DUF3797 domain-containing protein [Ectobacillus sp. JY-23]UOY91387.1 DUF3797 domain-containing protein [Ectobacillus sp. JY-23]